MNPRQEPFIANCAEVSGTVMGFAIVGFRTDPVLNVAILKLALDWVLSERSSRHAEGALPPPWRATFYGRDGSGNAESLAAVVVTAADAITEEQGAEGRRLRFHVEVEFGLPLDRPMPRLEVTIRRVESVLRSPSGEMIGFTDRPDVDPDCLDEAGWIRWFAWFQAGGVSGLDFVGNYFSAVTETLKPSSPVVDPLEILGQPQPESPKSRPASVGPPPSSPGSPERIESAPASIWFPTPPPESQRAPMWSLAASLPASRRDAASSVASALDRQIGPPVEPVEAAVFCPPAVSRETTFLVQVYLYRPQQAEVARAQAREADVDAERRGVLSLPMDVPRGTRIDLHLEQPKLLVDEPDAALIWYGTLVVAQFEVAVPSDAKFGTSIGRIRFSIAGVPAGTLRFLVNVAAAPTSEPARATEIALRRYRQAFVSYASQDRAEVLRRVQAFRIAGLSVFQDTLDLEPGDRWARELYRAIDDCDVMLLFWSRAAAESPWVAKEIAYALARKHGDEDRPPDIAPVPIEGPPIPAPPDNLRHLHFNDALLAHIAAAQATRESH